MTFAALGILWILYTLYLFKLNNNRLNLPILFAIYWFFFLAFAYIIYNNHYTFHYLSYMWIFCLCLVLNFGYIVGKGITKVKIKGSTIGKVDCTLKIYYNIITVFCIANLLMNILYLYRNYGLMSLLNIRGLISILNSAEIGRQTGDMADIGIINKVFNALYYMCVVMYGYMYADNHLIKKSLLLKMLLVLNIITGVFISAGKATIIFFIIMIMSGAITRLIEKDELKITNINYGKVGIAVILVIIVLYAMMNNRAGESVGLSGLFAYGFGEVPSFDSFFVSMNKEKTYGIQSFYGIVSLLNKRIPFSDGYGNYSLSSAYPYVNTFTVFRSVLSDFGLIGGMIWFFCFGIISGYATRKENRSSASIAASTLCMGYVLLGFLMPIGYYFSLFISYFLFGGMLYITTMTRRFRNSSEGRLLANVYISSN